MRLLCFGSLNIDKVYSVNHFVQAGETISSNSYLLFPGGKGLNQSVAAAKAGADVYHAGAVGADGKFLLDVLKESGANTDFVRTINSEPSGHALIQVDSSGQNCIIIHGGANHQISEQLVDEVLKHFTSGDMILLQNEINNVPYIIKSAHEKGMLVVLNPSPITDELLNYPLDMVDMFIMNEIEGACISGKKSKGDIISAMHTKFPSAKILLTLGEDGSCYYNGVKTIECGIYKTSVADTTAAGDTFTGYFLTEYCKGTDPEECLRISSVASGIAVSRKGASISIPLHDEVMKLL